ncbi:hypothetical protein ABT324_05360 [Saccharopolyspora sp. NPDC000359]|uniref:hypothetical protein n=1 Tax=Saccharopolyspora sp. NPDC000359 TaxID=3154251 RepID=UPI00333340EF
MTDDRTPGSDPTRLARGRAAAHHVAEAVAVQAIRRQVRWSRVPSRPGPTTSPRAHRGQRLADHNTTIGRLEE